MGTRRTDVASRGRSSRGSGQYKIWLDGNLTYDVVGRVTGLGDDLYFTPCTVTNTLTPAPVDIFVDDAMVSLSRATPEGRPTIAK